MNKQRWQPSAEKPFFIYDPEGEGFNYFSTEKERDDAASDCIQAYLDYGWDDQVKNVVAGVMTHEAKQIDRIDRPEENEIDEITMEDSNGNDWSHEFDYVCDYKLSKL